MLIFQRFKKALVNFNSITQHSNLKTISGCNLLHDGQKSLLRTFPALLTEIGETSSVCWCKAITDTFIKALWLYFISFYCCTARWTGVWVQLILPLQKFCSSAANPEAQRMARLGGATHGPPEATLGIWGWLSGTSAAAARECDSDVCSLSWLT